MTNDEALKIAKELLEFCDTNTVSEIVVDEYDAPLIGEGVKMKRYKKIEYIVRTIETTISPDALDKQIENLDTQIIDLTTQKEEILSIGEQIKTI